MKKLMALALCGALLVGGFSYWTSGNHAGTTAFFPWGIHASSSAYQPSSARQAYQPSKGQSAYIPSAHSF